MADYDKAHFRVSFYDSTLPTYLVNLDEGVEVLKRWHAHSGTGYNNTREETFHSWSYGQRMIENRLYEVSVMDSIEPFFWQLEQEKKFRKKIESNIKELLCSED